MLPSLLRYCWMVFVRFNHTYEIWTRKPLILANWISVISWKIPPFYVRIPQLWTGLGWNVGERFFWSVKILRWTVPYQMGFTSENLKCKHHSSSSLVNLSSPLLQEIRPKRTRQLAPPPVQYHLWFPLTFLFEKGKI